MSGARRKEERWEPSATETVELTGTVDFGHLHLFLSQEEQKRSDNEYNYIVILSKHTGRVLLGVVCKTEYG